MAIKQERMGGRIRLILSELLLREVADPRLHGITITNVELDKEMQYARVYVHVLDEEGGREEVMQGLKRANSFLRREVGQRVTLRKTPELHFIWDETVAKADRINQLLNSLTIPPPDPADIVARVDTAAARDGAMDEAIALEQMVDDEWDDADIDDDDIDNDDDDEWEDV